MKENTRYIIKAEKDKVDKSSNFKCAWCGVNLMERHHIKPYAEGGRNVSENLILLCSNCHTLVHQGKIYAEELFQRRKGLSGEVDRSSGFLSLNKEYAFKLGGNTFINTPNIISLNGENLISIRTQHNNLFISLRLYDKKRNLICWMEDNKWWVENEDIFDFTYSKNNFIVQSKEKEIYLQIDVEEDLINVSGNLYLNGYLLQFDKEDIKYYNPSYPQQYSTFKNCTIKDCKYAFSFDI